MKFTFISLFGNLIEPYFSDSILNRAIKNKKISINFINPRDFTTNKHNKVDDSLIGGGAGQLINAQPIMDTLKFVKKQEKSHIILLSPAGKSFKQNDAKRLSKKSHLVFVCGRYEGIDERVSEIFCDEIFSIGDFVLSGGELAAMVMSDAISRNIKDVLGNEESLSVESYENNLLEAPSFTKPNIIENSFVPSEFLKGNHGKIHSLKKIMSLYKTQFYRPDLYSKYQQRIK